MLSMTSVHDSIPEVSIVVPVYNEFDNLPDLVARIDAAMRTQPLSYELIAVDDGSSDGSAKRLRNWPNKTPGYAPSVWFATMASPVPCRLALTACVAAMW